MVTPTRALAWATIVGSMLASGDAEAADESEHSRRPGLHGKQERPSLTKDDGRRAFSTGLVMMGVSALLLTSGVLAARGSGSVSDQMPTLIAISGGGTGLITGAAITVVGAVLWAVAPLVNLAW